MTLCEGAKAPIARVHPLTRNDNINFDNVKVDTQQ
ncbi:MAG: hypothetical protein RLZZ210_779 [Pseudomonadota bacterium]